MIQVQSNRVNEKSWGWKACRNDTGAVIAVSPPEKTWNNEKDALKNGQYVMSISRSYSVTISQVRDTAGINDVSS